MGRLLKVRLAQLRPAEREPDAGPRVRHRELGGGQAMRVVRRRTVERRWTVAARRGRVSVAADLKTCRRCGEAKPLEAFPRNARTRDGRSSWCSDCHNSAKRQSRRKRRAEALLAEAAEYERVAERENGWRANSSLRMAEHLRREATRELERHDG